MISAKEAKEIILSNSQNWGKEYVGIEQSVNRIIQEDIYADRDFPPFDRITMDGIAIKFADFESGIREFELIGIQTAGEKAKTLIDQGQAIEIMTGAILTGNADVNIRYEDLTIIENSNKRIAKVNLDAVRKWQNIHQKGIDRGEGDLLIRVGKEISPADVGVLATVGKSTVAVSKMPKVAIISTGDELVEVDEKPEPHQVRMSNSICIQAHLNSLGIKNDRFHLLDDYDSLLVKIKSILDDYDVLILSGGVSKGKADYIPDVLNELEVEKLFHRVAQRPGKPFWFGKNKHGKCVFALPGNPISTFMCFTIYFMPWLYSSLKAEVKDIQMAVLGGAFSFKPELTYYLQVQLRKLENGVFIAEPKPGGGSGDLSGLLDSNGFMELPHSVTEYKGGEVFPVYPFRIF